MATYVPGVVVRLSASVSVNKHQFVPISAVPRDQYQSANILRGINVICCDSLGILVYGPNLNRLTPSVFLLVIDTQLSNLVKARPTPAQTTHIVLG